jgi:hypothetical protein
MAMYLEDYEFESMRYQCVKAMRLAAIQVIEAKTHCKVEGGADSVSDELGELATKIITDADIWPHYTRDHSQDCPKAAE